MSTRKDKIQTLPVMKLLCGCPVNTNTWSPQWNLIVTSCLLRSLCCCVRIWPKNLLLCSSYVKGKLWRKCGPHCVHVLLSSCLKMALQSFFSHVAFDHDAHHILRKKLLVECCLWSNGGFDISESALVKIGFLLRAMVQSVSSSPKGAQCALLI